MVAALAQLHDDVVYGSAAQFGVGWVEVQSALLANVVVEDALPGRQLDLEDLLALVREL